MKYISRGVACRYCAHLPSYSLSPQTLGYVRVSLVLTAPPSPFRAEPELAGGNRRERHAKTIDIAQEEILTCVGVFLYERLVKVWQRLRAEEQTWQILFFLGVETLKKNLEIALESSEGMYVLGNRNVGKL